MGKPTQIEIEELFSLARNKSVEARTTLANTVSDLFFGNENILSEHERELMMEILNQLIHDVERNVRQALAQRLSAQATAPRELVIQLANDEIDVARPILMKSPVLRDAELIEIIQHKTMEHQLAVSRREGISEDVTKLLVETGNANVITALLENPTASIASSMLSMLVDQSKQEEGFQKPLLRRPDLGKDLAKKMYWWVSAALRDHILENFEIDPSELDKSMEGAVEESIEKDEAEEDPEYQRPFQLAQRLAENESITPKLLIQVLRQGEILLFEALLVQLTKLRLTLVRRILFEHGGEGLAIICKASSVEKPDFASIFLLSRKTRPGDKVVDPRELSRVLKFYDRINAEAAEGVLQRMRLDPEYLNSIRKLRAEKD